MRMQGRNDYLRRNTHRNYIEEGEEDHWPRSRRELHLEDVPDRHDHFRGSLFDEERERVRDELEAVEHRIEVLKRSYREREQGGGQESEEELTGHRRDLDSAEVSHRRSFDCAEVSHHKLLETAESLLRKLSDSAEPPNRKLLETANSLLRKLSESAEPSNRKLLDTANFLHRKPDDMRAGETRSEGFLWSIDWINRGGDSCRSCRVEN